MSEERSQEIQLEKRRADWSQCAVVSVNALERHYFVDIDNPKREHAQIEKVIAEIQALTEQVKLTKSQNQLLQGFLDRLLEVKAFLPMKYKEVHQQRFSKQLENTTQGEAHIQELYALNVEQEEKVLRDCITHTNQPFIMLGSTTHRTTGSLFKAVEQIPQWELKHTAVLSFDHHSDLYGHDMNLLSKANVMGYLLHNDLIDRYAAFGTTDNETYNTDNAELFTGQSLYSQKHPDKEKFNTKLQRLFTHWKKANIEQVYISVDVDGLRLPEHRYTATDYNPHIQYIAGLARDHNFNELLTQQHQDTQLHTAVTFQIIERIQVALKSMNQPYYGIPASWVILAAQRAQQDFGFTLGIRNHDTNQRCIGDIAEYDPPDYKNRTAKIVHGIMNGLVYTAQQR